MRYIESPETYIESNKSLSFNDRSLFLAGGITNCPDWQLQMKIFLKDVDICLFNPRRKDFPIGDPSAAQAQIKWEYEYLRKASMILFWFPEETLCPIVLYELGSWSMTDKKIFVGIHPGYKRKQDVEIQTKLVRPFVNIVYDLGTLSEQIISECR